MNRTLLTLLVGLWKLVLFLPAPLLRNIFYILGRLFYVIPIKRNKFSKKNIDLCFPDMSEEKRKELHKKNVIASAKIIYYTGIAWFWSNKKISKNINYEIRGIELLKREKESKNGVLLFFKHSLHLELDGRLFGMNYEAYGVERTHNSESFNFIQKTGRLKSVKDTCDRNNPLKFIRLLKKGEVILYAADQDYGLDQSEIVNFFNQPAATISAPIKIINSTGCKPYFLNSFKDGDKYIIEIEELDFDKSSNLDFLKNLNLFMENKIRKNPEEYLWQHRRFKSTLGKKNFYG